MGYQHGSVSNVYLHQTPKTRKCYSIVLPKFKFKNAEETLTGKVLYNWLEAVYLKQVVPPIYMFPASKFYILYNNYPNFQCREPVRTRSRDDPRAGQSNIVVSRTPVKISEAAHVFFCFFFAFFGVFSKVKGTAFVGSETDRFL